MRSIVDIPSALIAIVAVGSLTYFKKLKEPFLILIAAVAGLLLKSFF
jgi:chromate transporter